MTSAVAQSSQIMWALGLPRAQAGIATSDWFMSRKDHWSLMSAFSATDLGTTVANSKWPLSAKSMSRGPQWPVLVTRPNGMIMCPSSTNSCLRSRGVGHCPRVPKQCFPLVMHVDFCPHTPSNPPPYPATPCPSPEQSDLGLGWLFFPSACPV